MVLECERSAPRPRAEEKGCGSGGGQGLDRREDNGEEETATLRTVARGKGMDSGSV